MVKGDRVRLATHENGYRIPWNICFETIIKQNTPVIYEGYIKYSWGDYIVATVKLCPACGKSHPGMRIPVRRILSQQMEEIW